MNIEVNVTNSTYTLTFHSGLELVVDLALLAKPAKVFHSIRNNLNDALVSEELEYADAVAYANTLEEIDDVIAGMAGTKQQSYEHCNTEYHNLSENFESIEE